MGMRERTRLFAYYFGLAALLTHELDAVAHSEWLLLFHVFELSDGVAEVVFIALHFPIFAAFLFFSHHSNTRKREWFRISICVFLVLHGFAHYVLSDHLNYYFDGLLSNFYIFGATVFALIYLGLTRRSSFKSQ